MKPVATLINDYDIGNRLFTVNKLRSKTREYDSEKLTMQLGMGIESGSPSEMLVRILSWINSIEEIESHQERVLLTLAYSPLTAEEAEIYYDIINLPSILSNIQKDFGIKVQRCRRTINANNSKRRVMHYWMSTTDSFKVLEQLGWVD